MKYNLIFVMASICTTCIYTRSTNKDDNSWLESEVGQIYNDIMERGYAKNAVKRDVDIIFPTTNVTSKRNIEQVFELYNSALQRNAVERDGEAIFPPINETTSTTDEDFAFDISELERKKKAGKKSLPRNCKDIFNQGKNSGTHMVYPCDHTPSKSVKVYCDMNNGGGWTVIQRRGKYTTQQNFYRTYNQYMLGFGDVTKDFWLGNDNIHCLTRQSFNEIRFDLDRFNGTKGYASYDFFYVAGVNDYYQMQIGIYSGTAGDSFSYHNGMNFTTWDADHDSSSSTNCAKAYKGAWWYGSCHHCNLNGIFNGTSWQGLVWYTFSGGKSLMKTEMKIRPKYD